MLEKCIISVVLDDFFLAPIIRNFIGLIKARIAVQYRGLCEYNNVR